MQNRTPIMDHRTLVIYLPFSDMNRLISSLRWKTRSNIFSPPQIQYITVFRFHIFREDLEITVVKSFGLDEIYSSNDSSHYFFEINTFSINFDGGNRRGSITRDIPADFLNPKLYLSRTFFRACKMSSLVVSFIAKNPSNSS